MSRIAIGVNVGPPVESGIVPVTSSDISGDVAAAVTALGTVTTAVAAAKTATETAKTDAADSLTAAAATLTAATTADDQVATVQGDTAGVNAAIDAALANGTISGNPTALGLVQAIETAYDAQIAKLATAKTNTASAKTAATTGNTDATTASNSAVAADAAADAISLTALDTALDNASTTISAADMIIDTGTTLLANVAEFSACAASGTEFVRVEGILPSS